MIYELGRSEKNGSLLWEDLPSVADQEIKVQIEPKTDETKVVTIYLKSEVRFDLNHLRVKTGENRWYQGGSVNDESWNQLYTPHHTSPGLTLKGPIFIHF